MEYDGERIAINAQTAREFYEKLLKHDIRIEGYSLQELLEFYIRSEETQYDNGYNAGYDDGLNAENVHDPENLIVPTHDTATYFPRAGEIAPVPPINRIANPQDEEDFPF